MTTESNAPPSPIERYFRRLFGDLVLIGSFLALIWIVFAVSLLAPINQYGLEPRSVEGLIGIVSMPFLHANLMHIVANTFPLVVLLGLLAGSRANSWMIVAAIIVGGGAILWLCGRGERDHIGASGLIFGLIAFLVLGGAFERRLLAVLIAAVVLLLYGSTLVFGILPTDPGVSWDGHLAGAVAGGVLSFSLARRKPAAAA